MHDPDRIPLSEAELDAVADRVFEKIKAFIGGSAIKALVWIAGTAIVAVVSYLGFSHTTPRAP